MSILPAARHILPRGVAPSAARNTGPSWHGNCGSAPVWLRNVTFLLPGQVVRALITLLLLLLTFPAVAQVRIKDIADIEGVRDNQLIGYGLVVGLNNTGDKLSNAIFTRDTLVNMLQRLGVNTQDQTNQLQTKNIAAVMVAADYAKLPRRINGLLERCDALHNADHISS
jgi:flagellar P-ring protein FlgI